MCGRYTSAGSEKIAEFFGAEPATPFGPRYKVAPGTPIAVVGLKPDQTTRGVARLKWGLVTYWSGDAKNSPTSKLAGRID